MDDEYQIDYDTSCPKCNYEFTHYRRCTNIFCEDGMIDESDEDYLLPFTELSPCAQCNGTGFEQWCPHCGHDLTLEEMDNDEYFK